MWFTLRREGVEFVERARSVHVAEATMAAPRARVFDAFVDPDGWPGLVEACPWQDEPGSSGADRFVWRIEVRSPEPPRLAELPDTAVQGPWRELVDRVREEGLPVAPPARTRTERTDG